MSLNQKIADDVTARIIAELEKGAAPWIKPWTGTAAGDDRNVVSQKAYRGINRLLLGMAGYTSPEWATYKQWQEKGAQVRKGEKSTQIIFFKKVSKEEAGPMPEGEEGQNYSAYFLMRYYFVFNASQVDGYQAAPVEALPEVTRHARADQTIAGTAAQIAHGGSQAFYRPSTDSIMLPEPGTFKEMAAYYATAFHELTHWTGAKSRLDRDLDKGRFGNPEYAFEELVAEMGAAFLCADHGIQGDLRHAGYIASWLKCLRENNKAVFRAAALAQNAAEYILTDRSAEQIKAA